MADPQGALLGNAVGYVDINTSGVTTNLNRAKQEFNNFISQTGSMMQSWGNQIAGFGQNLTLWTAPVALAVGTGLNVAADFDSVLTEIQARTGLTAEAMEQVRQTALQMGADTAFSSQQAADAFLNLLTAGLSVEDALSTLPQVLTAAAAGGMDLGSAADYTTSIMASFNLTAEDATTIVNALAQASGATPATMAEMAAALNEVGSNAKLLNLDVTDTTAILAIFAQNGIRGVEAGNQLKAMILQLAESANTYADDWAALGTSLYDANGNMRDFDTVLAEIRVGLERLPVEQQNIILQHLAGSFGITGFNALLASDGIDAMVASMGEQATATDVAAQMMNSFKGVVDAFKGSMETLWITVMTPYMNNVLRPMFQRKTEMINQITAWAAANEPLVQTIMQIVGAFLTLGPILVGVGVAMQVVGGALATIGTVVGVLLSPMTLLIAGVAGLAYVFRTELAQAIQTGMQWLNAMWIFLSTFVSDMKNLGIGEAILGIFGEGSDERAESTLEGMLFRMGFSRQEAIRITYDVFTVFSHWFIQLRMLFANFQNSISGAFTYVQQIFAVFFRLLNEGQPLLFALKGAFFTAFGNTIWFERFLSVLREIAASVGNVFNRIIAVVRPAFTQISTFFQNNTEKVWQFIQTFLGIGRLFNPIGQLTLLLQLFGTDALSVFEGVTAGVTRMFENMNSGGSFLEGLRAAFGDSEIFNSFINLITNTVMPVLEQFRAWFMDTALPGISDFIANSFIPSIGSLINILVNIWSIVGPPLMEMGAWFLNTGMPAILQGLEQFTGWLSSLGVGEGMRALSDWFLNTALPVIVDFMVNTVIPNVQAFINLLVGIWNAVSPALTSLWDWFMASGVPQIISQVVDFLTPSLNDIINLISGIWNVVSPALTSLLDWFVTTGLPAIQNFIANTFQPAFQTFIDFLAAIWTNVSGGFETFKTGVQAAFQWVIDNGVNLLQTAWDGLVSLLTGIWSSVSGGIESFKTGLSNAFNWVKTNVIDPLVGAVQGLLDLLGTIASAAQNAASTAGSAINNAISNASSAITGTTTGVGGTGQAGNSMVGVTGPKGKLGSFASGIDFVPQDMIALIHAGERVQRASENPYNPDNAGKGGGGLVFEAGSIVVNGASGYQQGLEAGRGIGDGILERWREKGGT